MTPLENKLAQFVAAQIEKNVSQKLGTAAYKNIAPTGQPALEGEIMMGNDVRVLEAMRTSVYDTDGDGEADGSGGSSMLAVTFVEDADYTVVDTDELIVFTDLTAGRTLTLPAASSGNIGRMIIFANFSTLANSVTSSENIYTNPSTFATTIPTGSFMRIVSIGSHWLLL